MQKMEGAMAAQAMRIRVMGAGEAGSALRKLSAVASEPGGQELIEKGERLPFRGELMRDGAWLLLRDGASPLGLEEAVEALRRELPEGFHAMSYMSSAPWLLEWEGEGLAAEPLSIGVLWVGGVEQARPLWGSPDWSHLICQAAARAWVSPGAGEPVVREAEAEMGLRASESELRLWRQMAAEFEASAIAGSAELGVKAPGARL